MNYQRNGGILMEKYHVTIEGRVYEVIVEEIREEVAAQAVERKPASGNTVQGTPVPAPLSGVVLSVKVKPGDMVKRGQVILTLEALKLENEIVAPTDGKILEIVAEGETVETGQTLALIG